MTKMDQAKALEVLREAGLSAQPWIEESSGEWGVLILRQGDPFSECECERLADAIEFLSQMKPENTTHH